MIDLLLETQACYEFPGARRAPDVAMDPLSIEPVRPCWRYTRRVAIRLAKTITAAGPFVRPAAAAAPCVRDFSSPAARR